MTQGSVTEPTMDLTVQIAREEDGRWIAEVLEIPGVLCYGCSEADARVKAKALALCVLAQRVQCGECPPVSTIGFTCP